MGWHNRPFYLPLTCFGEEKNSRPISRIFRNRRRTFGLFDSRGLSSLTLCDRFRKVFVVVVGGFSTLLSNISEQFLMGSAQTWANVRSICLTSSAYSYVLSFIIMLGKVRFILKVQRIAYTFNLLPNQQFEPNPSSY